MQWNHNKLLCLTNVCDAFILQRLHFYLQYFYIIFIYFNIWSLKGWYLFEWGAYLRGGGRRGGLIWAFRVISALGLCILSNALMSWLLFLLPNVIVSGILFCRSEFLRIQQFSRGILRFNFWSRDSFSCCRKDNRFLLLYSTGLKSMVPPQAIRSLFTPVA